MKDFTLSREQIIEAVQGVRGGTITRVTYKTELPVKAEFKKKGYRVFKIVETSARIGVNYGQIASVRARAEELIDKTVPKKADNYEWVIKDRIRHNTKTDKDYVVLISFNKGHNTKVKYIIEGTFVGTVDMGDTLEQPYKHIVLDSYFSKKSTSTEFRNVSFENIIRINKIGTKVVF